MNTENNTQNLGEEVHQQNYESSMKDLVFDPVTGEFKQVDRGTNTGEGEVVTEMTNKGFAC